VTTTVAAPQDGVPVESTAQQVESARTQLRQLEMRFTADHPDVRMLQRRLRELESKLQTEVKPSAAGDPRPERTLSAAEALRQKRARDLKAQLDDLDRQLTEKQQQEARLHLEIADYQTKLDAGPSRESDLVELTRDYTTVQTTYQSLLAKREESKLAANLERRNIGEQFNVLDPARVPERPFSPNRILIALGGSGIGIAFGVIVADFLEHRDTSFASEEDVVLLCQLPVLAVVPLMISSEERRTGRRRTMLVGIAAAVFALMSAAAIVAWSIR
jgi:uncharacterized protein involved in exopolysaccharide biosynthesis